MPWMTMSQACGATTARSWTAPPTPSSRRRSSAMPFPFSLRRTSRLEGAAWLNERLLLLTGRLGHDEEEHAAFANGGKSETPLETHVVSHHVNGDGGGADRATLVVAFP